MQGAPILDRLMANAWRPVVDERHGGWRYRWANGVTRRANSVLAVDSTEPLENLVDRAEAFYRQRDAPTLLQLSTVSAPQSLTVYLSSRGYRPTAKTLVEEAATDTVAERTEPSFDIEIADALSDDWFHSYWRWNQPGRSNSDRDMVVCRDGLLAPALPTVFATARDAREVVGVGQLVIEQGWAGVQCMTTAPGHRRRGVANAVLNGLATEALQREIRRMYLAVIADNDAATSLYNRAGFKVTHSYSYYTNQPDQPG